MKLVKTVMVSQQAQSWKYFAASAALVAAMLIGIDRYVIPHLEDEGKLVSVSWKTDNKKYTKLGFEKNQAREENCVWRSAGWPVSESKSKRKRILVMGDSFVWGIGLSNMNDIWWRQLGKELFRRGYGDVEVMGAGLPCMSTREQLEQAKRLVPLYHPDLIIWGYVTNDPEERDAQTRENVVKAMYEVPKDLRPLRDSLAAAAPNLSEVLFDMRDKVRSRALSGKIGEFQYYDWELELLRGENFRRYRETVASLASYLREEKIESFVMTLPVGGPAHFKPWEYDKKQQSVSSLLQEIRSYYEARYTPVQRLFQENGVSFENNLDDYLRSIVTDKKMSKLDTPLRLGANPADGHPGPFVTQFYAVEAANILEKKYKQCLGPCDQGTIKFSLKPHINDWLPPDIWLQQVNDSEMKFAWPQRTSLLNMPLRRPFVQLNLEQAAAIKSIRLDGSGLREADIFVTCEDPDGHYDTREHHQLGVKKGSDLSWQLPDTEWAKHISTIKIAATVRVDPMLHLQMSPANSSLLSSKLPKH